MNGKKRKVLHKVLDELERLKDPIMDNATALGILKDSQKKVELIMDEEESDLDSRPENLLWSTVTANMQDNVSDLTDANCNLECVVEDCKNMSEFDYSVIKNDICKIVHSLNLAIYRK